MHDSNSKRSDQEKLAIVLEGLRHPTALPEVCKKHGITNSLYCRWRDELLKDTGRIGGLLRESEECFHRAFYDAPIGMSLVALDGTRLQVNRALCGILGYSEEELLSTRLQDTIYSEDLEPSLNDMDELLLGNVPYCQREVRYRHKDGHLIWTLVAISLVRDGERPVHFITQIQDITERKKADAERQMLVHDLTERVKELTVLHGVARLLQKEQKAPTLLMAEIAELLRGALQYADIAAARIVFENEEYKTSNFCPTPWRLAVEIDTMNGGHGSVEIVYLEERPKEAEGPFLSEEKKLIESVSEMLKAYFERKQAERRVTQMTREVTERNEELWRLQGQVGRVERLAALGKITASISHDLGTPLNSVLGYIQLLDQEDLSENVQRRLKIIAAQVKRMADIIQQYLSVTHTSFGGDHQVDLNQLTRDTLDVLDPFLKQQRVDVHTVLSNFLPMVWGDSDSLQRVLINLVDNAVDATGRDGKLTIKTYVHTTISGEKTVVLEVSDTGVGIPPHVVPKIFDFFMTTKATGKGTGLGLAISQEIVRKHGGKIEIQSQVGEGTCVRVSLPTADEDRADQRIER